MKTALILGLVALAGTAMFLFNQESINLQAQNTSLYQEYTMWKSLYGENFNGDLDEYRFAVFTANKKIVEEENAKATGSLRLGMNKFAALTLEEFVEKNIPKMQIKNNSTTKTVDFSNKTAPESINWVEKGAVAPVEDQGSCGSCWAFSTKEGLEGLYQIKTGNLEVFSAQQLVDCSKWNLGCSGGDPISAYNYTKNNGIELESDYPYVSGTTTKAGECQYNASKVVFKNDESVRVEPENNAAAIMAAAANQPLTIEVAAGNIAFQLYTSGVINSSMCGTALDHGVLLSGYNNSGDEPYWTIKNSWGTGWGQKGYGNILLQESGPGMCGIQQYAAYGEWNN